jgi:hypothetical protein
MISIQNVGMSYGKPPLKRLAIDLTLENTTSQARWFSWPISLPETGPDGGVDTVTAAQLAGSGRVVLVRLSGTGGRHAVHLAPGARAVLRGVELKYWGDEPPVLDVPVVSSKELRLGGEELGAWLAADLLSTGGEGKGEGPSIARKETPELKELPLDALDPQTTVVPVALKK